jgi:hypothetical protein
MPDVIDLLGHAVEGMAVWRYLLSPSYRRRTHSRWRSQSRLETGLEVFFCGLSFLFITAILCAIVWWFAPHPNKADEELQIQQSVLRYQFEHNAAAKQYNIFALRSARATLPPMHQRS